MLTDDACWLTIAVSTLLLSAAIAGVYFMLAAVLSFVLPSSTAHPHTHINACTCFGVGATQLMLLLLTIMLLLLWFRFFISEERIELRAS